MKRTISVLLAVLLIAALCASAFAEPIVKPAITEKPASNVDQQLDLIFRNLSQLYQETDAKELWSYSVTDLDHNGSLELIAAIQKGAEFYTYAKIWEVSKDLTSFIECDMGVKEGEPFVDIICDSADTYYDKTNDTWYYMFSENYINEAEEYYAVKCSVSLKNDYVTPKAYAYEHVSKVNGVNAVEFSDLNGAMLTPEQYAAAGSDAFSGFEKSGTNFGWFHATEATSVSPLTESYEIFCGSREPAKEKQNNSIIIVPKPTSNPSGYLMITKNPTSEYHRAGETAVFIAYAQNYENIKWTFVSPGGGTFEASDMRSMFGCTVSGEKSTTLSVGNLSEAMDGWGVYCTFSGYGQYASTSTAYININFKPVPTPVPQPTIGPVQDSSMTGNVSDFWPGSVELSLSNGYSVTVSIGICNIVGGDLVIGCPCTVWYRGWIPDETTVYSVYIQGLQPEEDVPEIDPWYPVFEEEPVIIEG